MRAITEVQRDIEAATVTYNNLSREMQDIVERQKNMRGTPQANVGDIRRKENALSQLAQAETDLAAELAQARDALSTLDGELHTIQRTETHNLAVNKNIAAENRRHEQLVTQFAAEDQRHDDALNQLSAMLLN